jgi:hypothetical protein
MRATREGLVAQASACVILILRVPNAHRLKSVLLEGFRSL